MYTDYLVFMQYEGKLDVHRSNYNTRLSKINAIRAQRNSTYVEKEREKCSLNKYLLLVSYVPDVVQGFSRP